MRSIPIAAQGGYLAGQMLIAMPGMTDRRFAGAVIYVCAHSAQGAMGLVVNRRTNQHITFPDLLRQLSIPLSGAPRPISVQYGGPVEIGRGFVIHTTDYVAPGATLSLGQIGVTATLDILKDLARGGGPSHAVLALGYAGWQSGQLESEIHRNAWLHCEPDAELLFGVNLEAKWHHAVQKIGIDPAKLSGGFGRA